MKTVNFAKFYKRLDTTCRAHDYAGWDPFDALNSKLFQLTPFARSKWMRLAWLQFFKRAPANFRASTFVPRTHNAKALALFVRSYLQEGDKASADHCFDKMMELRSDTTHWGEAAWGYPFDWQAKAFFVAKGVPNVICTTYALLAVEAAAEAKTIEAKEAQKLTLAAADFVLAHLLRKNEQGTYIAYIPSSDALVHNASLWGALICTKAYRASGDVKYRDVANKVIDTTLKAQGEKGEWVYGTMSHHQFIDGFHTGYNLESLFRSNQILERDDIAAAITKGINYYTETFFDEDGQAAYYHNNPYPLDPHSAAQGILTLKLIDAQKYQPLIEKIGTCVCTHLWDARNGYFYYQKTKSYMNRLCYLRWTQAWMHLALSALK
ncbi:MAG: hypothetical protein P8P30_05430 [Rickettsiales bacterium]|nr:hypothetical protein [Rickettsiales bacterium]